MTDSAEAADIESLSSKLSKLSCSDNIESINKRIKSEICYDTINRLSDENLRSEYLECKSVKNSIQDLTDILTEYVDNDTNNKIIDKYLSKLIPPGTKGVIRGNKFNKIVKEYIQNLNLDNEKFEVCFEKKCDKLDTSEIPDWYILNRKSGKIIIGMNQLSLWGGGQQTNRGAKYIQNEYDYKLSGHQTTDELCSLCVICNEIQFTSDKNKAYKIFETGFKNDSLCYIKNLGNIIKSYFTDNQITDEHNSF